MKQPTFDPHVTDPFDPAPRPSGRPVGPWTVAALIAGGAGVAVLIAGAGVALGAGLAFEALRPREPALVHASGFAGGPQLAAPPSPAVETAITAPIPSGRPRIEVAFVMDTTGSMGGLLRAARLKAWSIANALADLEPRPDVAMGLVGYKDHGDEHVTRVVPMTRDLDAFYGELAALRAIGGGDRPEAVDVALRDAVGALGWSAPDPTTTRLIVLMGDAPPHVHAPGLVEAARARARGITVSTLLVGDDREAAAAFARIAAAGGGVALTLAPTAQGRLAEQVTTPIDAEIAALQRRIEATVVPYGTAAQQQALRAQWSRNATLGGTLGVEVYVSRASAQCKTGGFYEHDLLAALDAGRVTAGDLRADQLPPGFDPATLEALRRERAAARAALADAVARRDAWLRARAPRGGLDARLLELVRRRMSGC